MRFLIVDDDFDSRRLVQKILHPYGYVDIATDGEEGIEAFQRALKEGEPYNLITLDIMMPNMNGQEALREIREMEKEAGVTAQNAAKVLMVTGLDDSKEVHDAFFLGDATSFIVKPIRKQHLIEEIAKLGVTLVKTESSS